MWLEGIVINPYSLANKSRKKIRFFLNLIFVLGWVGGWVVIVKIWDLLKQINSAQLNRRLA